MSDEDPHPPDEEGSSPQPGADSGGETLPISPSELAEGEALRARLAALDRLYETKAITLAELGDARRAILSGLVGERLTPILGPEASSMIASAVQQPPGPPTAPEVGTSGPPGPPPPAMPATQHIGPLPPPKPTRILGLPVWAAAAIAGALVVGAVLAVVFLVLGGSDSSKPAVATTSDYSAQVRAPLSLLTRSAVETGKALGRVSQPGDIAGLHKVASRQLDAVEKARTNVATIRVVPSARRAQAQLIRAAALQRRYLVQMGRATSGTPTQASLAAVNRTRRAAGEAVIAYRTFFALVPDAPDAITGTDLADTSGLSQAVKAGIAAAAAPSQSGRTTGPSRSSTYSGSSFQSPTGNLRCEIFGDSLFCSSSNDGFGVTLPSYGSPATGSGIASGGVSVPYGSTWVSGSFRCDSAFDGITCQNSSGNGFFLNRDQYEPF
jgi:hypothetical protein